MKQHLKVEAFIERQIPETWDAIFASDESGVVEIGLSDLGFGPREIAQLAGIADPDRIPRSAQQWRDLALGIIETSEVQIQERDVPDDQYRLYQGW